MFYLDKAVELGQALLECDETTILKAAEANLENDREAQQLIREFQQRHHNIEAAREAGAEVSEDDWREFNDIQEQMKGNKAVQAYFAAQQNFQKLLQQVNSVVNQVLSGESCSGDCSGNCPGCM